MCYLIGYGERWVNCCRHYMCVHRMDAPGKSRSSGYRFRVRICDWGNNCIRGWPPHIEGLGTESKKRKVTKEETGARRLPKVHVRKPAADGVNKRLLYFSRNYSLPQARYSGPTARQPTASAPSRPPSAAGVIPAHQNPSPPVPRTSPCSGAR